ncbi:MAG: outer membrane lipoprotein-sorting protein [Candidatus Kapaibacteriota bacterium]|jgi:outer membrane lipoprotein-sorting protein
MFQKMVLLLGIFFTFFAVNKSFSQTDEEIISNFIKKQKEISDMSKLKTLFQEFKVSIMGMEMPNKLWIKGDNMRYETSFMGQSTVVVVTPNSAWQVQNGAVTDLPSEQIPLVKQQLMGQTFAGMLNFSGEAFSSDYINFEIVGRENIEGVNCFQLKSSPKDTSGDNTSRIFWFEPKTYLLRKISLKGQGMGKEQNIDIFVKEYQQIGGLTFPKLVEIQMGDGQSAKIEYTTVKINEPLEDSLFKK